MRPRTRIPSGRRTHGRGPTITSTTEFVTTQSTAGTFHSCRTVSSAGIHQGTATFSIRNPFLSLVLNPLYAIHPIHATSCTHSSTLKPFVTSLPPHTVLSDSQPINKCGRFPRSATGPILCSLLCEEDGSKGQPQYNSNGMQKNETTQKVFGLCYNLKHAATQV